ncbi:MAG: aspartate aminotransferase family protein [Acidimicrobiales bacterium]|nr:aspartate aminotransferase family protein [Acidimicrobiales bacterium]MCB1250561.1 aspartate aminotransferase family protein [Acidimicrobiales bacterium]
MQTFPEHGTPAEAVLAEVDTLQGGDIDWRGGRAFSLVYHPDDAALEALLHEVANRYLHENALNPFKYPSLVQMEKDVVAMAASLLGTDPEAGSLSSGGTESIFLAVHTARSWGDGRGVATPNIITPDTVHPAFAKACHYLRIEHRRVPVGPDLRADVEAMAAAIDDNTVLLVGSAPCYPYGVIDPIPALGQVALAHDTLLHVDACLGGWMLPWWERLGEPVPPWDFRVEGVTSMSADIHKYGYTFKGASTVLYRDPELVRHQWFLYDEWPGGLYGSITTAGTRPAAPMAGAWAAIRFLGADGYLRKATQVRDATRAFQAAIAGIDGLAVTGTPDMSVFEFGPAPGSGVDIGAVGDGMDDRGWNLDRQQGGLHLMVSPYHLTVTDRFAVDLADAVAAGGTSRGKAAGYGGIAGMDD